MIAQNSLENIPSELRALPQWVCWHYETRIDKNGNETQTKPPIDAKSNGKLVYAKTNDPATWANFETAVAAVSRLNLEGQGLCLSESDGLTGIDLDHVLNRETGELDPLAVEVLSQFAGTYAEISPGGDGIRIWCYGKPGRSGRNPGVKWLEIYSHPSHRFLTVTGNRYGAVTAVTPQQPALDWLHSRFMVKPQDTSTKRKRNPSSSVDALDLNDATLLDKAQASRKGGSQFTALWSGDLSAHGGDRSAADLALCNALAFWTGKDPARMDRLFRQSGLMRPKWDERRGEQTYGERTLAVAIEGTREVFAPRKNNDRPVLRPPEQPEQPNPFRGTDDANADLLLEQHGADIHYCPTWDKWILWTGSHWRIDDRLDIERLAADVPKRLRGIAIARTEQRQKILSQATDLMAQINAGDLSQRLHEEHTRLRKQETALGDESDWLIKLASKLEGTSKRGSMLTAARHKVVVHHSELDQFPSLINASNGTVDLQNGRLRPHSRADLLTHGLEIPFVPNATAPAWLAFLHSTFGGDDALIQFVQRAIGYSLTGDVREQVLLICHGVGSNGKSVFLNILRKLLGSLAIQAAPDLLMADKQRRHPTEQADLYGKRIIICQETGEGRRFNETLVKQLTGGDGIRARRMHEDFWEFNPTHKLWISTNHKPEIRGTDYAIWRRIRLIPFNVTFTDDGEPRKNPDMERQLTAELPGILAWAVAGCLDWQRNGLQQPDAVKSATADYQAEMDVLAAWLADCCVVEKHCTAKASELYANYSRWCENSGEYAGTQRKWGMRLTERGFLRFTNDGSWYRGIGIKKPTEGTEPTEPEKAIFEKSEIPIDHAGKNAKSGSVGSDGSVNQNQSATADDLLSSPLAVRIRQRVELAGKAGIEEKELEREAAGKAGAALFAKTLNALALRLRWSRVNGCWLAGVRH